MPQIETTTKVNFTKVSGYDDLPVPLINNPSFVNPGSRVYASMTTLENDERIWMYGGISAVTNADRLCM